MVALAPDHEDAADLLSAVHAAQNQANTAARQQLAESRQPDPAPSRALQGALVEAVTLDQQPIAAAATQGTGGAREQTPVPSVAKGGQRWRIAFVLVALLALGGAAAFVWLQLGKSAAQTARENIPSPTALAAATAPQTGAGIVQPTALTQATAPPAAR